MAKVLIIGPRAFPADFVGTSGVESYVSAVAMALVAADPQLELEILTRTAYQDHVVSHVPHPRIKVTPLPTFPGRVWEAVGYSFLASLLACGRRADVVWYHTAGMAIAGWLPALCGKRIWVTVHSLDWQRKKWHPWERTSFRSAFLVMMRLLHHAAFFAVTQALADKISLLTQHPCAVAHPGLPHPTELPKPSHRQPNLLYLGRLVPEKRVEWLLEYAVTHGVPCMVVGTHGNTPEYERKLRQQYQSKYVQWYGSAIGKEKWEVLAQARLLVLPSELEGFPITILEAVAVRTPCLLAHGILPSDFASLPLIKTFAPQSQVDFNQVLQRLLRQRSQRRSFSSADRRTLARYTWQRTAQTYAAFLPLQK